MRNNTGDTPAPERQNPGQLLLPLPVTHGIALDGAGHFCGQDAVTGALVPPEPGKCGYCGPDCGHCAPHRFYALEDGVWVCAADSSYLDA